MIQLEKIGAKINSAKTMRSFFEGDTRKAEVQITLEVTDIEWKSIPVYGDACASICEKQRRKHNLDPNAKNSATLTIGHDFPPSTYRFDEGGKGGVAVEFCGPPQTSPRINMVRGEASMRWIVCAHLTPEEAGNLSLLVKAEGATLRCDPKQLSLDLVRANKTDGGSASVKVRKGKRKAS